MENGILNGKKMDVLDCCDSLKDDSFVLKILSPFSQYSRLPFFQTLKKPAIRETYA